MNDHEKLDLLWKHHVANVSHTSKARRYVEEPYPFKHNVLESEIWFDSKNIPVPAAVFSGVVEGHTAGFELQLDPTAPDRLTWLAVKSGETPPYTKTKILGEWISPRIDPSYTVRVFRDSSLTQELLPYEGGYEWIFDYNVGVLYFMSKPPVGATKLWITGYRYVGRKEVPAYTPPPDPPSPPTRYSFNHDTVSSLNVDQRTDVDFETGPAAILVDVIVQSSVAGGSPACTIECHSTPARNDTNPYVFVATVTHTRDDGRWVSYGETFYGVRYINILNNEVPPKNFTYWRIIKREQPGPILLTVVVEKLNGV